MGVELLYETIIACASKTAGQMLAVSVVMSASVVIAAEPDAPIVGPVRIGVADEYTTLAKSAEFGTPGELFVCVIGYGPPPDGLPIFCWPGEK